MEGLGGVWEGEVDVAVKGAVGEGREIGGSKGGGEGLQEQVRRDLMVWRLKLKLVDVTYETFQKSVFLVQRLGVVRQGINTWQVRMTDSGVYVLKLIVPLSNRKCWIIKPSPILPISESIPNPIFLTIIDPSLNQHQIFLFNYLILISVSGKCVLSHGRL